MTKKGSPIGAKEHRVGSRSEVRGAEKVLEIYHTFYSEDPGKKVSDVKN